MQQLQQLIDVQNAMKAGAAVVLEKDIDWHKALLAWKRTLIGECLDQNEGIVFRVGRKLRVGDTAIKRLVADDPALKAKVRSPSKKKPYLGSQK